MSVRLRYKIEVAISSTDAEEKDLANAKYEVVADTEGEGGSYKLSLAAAAADVPVHLQTLGEATFVCVRATPKDPTDAFSDVTLKMSLAGEAITLKPIGDQKEAYYLMNTGSVTELYASNPGTIPMELTIFTVGD